jgi:hypothetical protein
MQAPGAPYAGIQVRGHMREGPRRGPRPAGLLAVAVVKVGVLRVEDAGNVIARSVRGHTADEVTQSVSVSLFLGIPVAIVGSLLIAGAAHPVGQVGAVVVHHRGGGGGSSGGEHGGGQCGGGDASGFGHGIMVS